MKNSTTSDQKESLTDGGDVTFLSKKKKGKITFISKSNSPVKSEGSASAEGKSGNTGTHPKIPSASNSKESPEPSPHVQDAETLTATELRKKYKPTYDSWRNMKQRVHSEGAVIDPEFEEFRDFLKLMGPRPGKEFTLDRLNNYDPRYGPKRCFWRDKQAQNNNKSTTVFLTAPDGIELSLTQWAKITDQKPNTMRKRKNAGWSDHEIIAGKRFTAPNAPASDKCLDELPWPGDHKRKLEWELCYREAVEVEWEGSPPKESRHEYLLRWALERSKELGEEYGGCADWELPTEISEETRVLEKILRDCRSHVHKQRTRKVIKERARISELGAKKEYAISELLRRRIR